MTSNPKTIGQEKTAGFRTDHVSDFDWSTWSPGVRSTIVFVRQGDQVLLIDKKTGLGQGKVNGPGGKVEANEGWIECAQREVMEELSIVVTQLKWCAELRFLMSDYPDILCHVFITNHYEGEPVESLEARPFWSLISEIPYANMWEDDQYWLPRALLGERVLGLFSFDQDRMMSLAVSRHRQQDLDDLP